MRFYHPVLKAGRTWWDHELFPVERFADRLGQVQMVLQRLGADALLAYGDAQRYGHLTYISHYLPKHRGGLVVVPRNGEPVLFIEAGSREIPWARSLSWINDVRAASDGVARGLAEVLVPLGPAPRLALAGLRELMRSPDWEDILPLLGDPSRTLDVAEELTVLRRTKERNEQEAVTHAAEMVTAGFEAAAGILAAGASTDVLMAAAERAMRRLGAEDMRMAVSVEPDSEPWPATRQVLPAHGGVRIGLAASYQRYWAQAARTLSAGLQDLIADTAAVHTACLVNLGPGRSAEGTVAALSTKFASLQAAGVLKRLDLRGIGLDLDEPLGTASLQAGATLVLHTTTETASEVRILLADTVLLTKDGARVLTGKVDAL